MDFFLQIDTDGTIGPDDFIAADSGRMRNISSRVRDTNVNKIVANHVVSAFHGGGHQAVKEMLGGARESRLRGLE